MRDHLEDALDHWFSGTRGWLPAVDVVRRPGKLIVRADLPGMRADELKVEVEDDLLTISGSREKPKEKPADEYLREDRRYGPFSRSIALPVGADAAKIEARAEDGVAEITIPLSP